MAKQKVNKNLKELNELLKKKPIENNIFTKKVLTEKCHKGREISPIFLKRVELFYGNNIHPLFDKYENRMEDDLIELLKKFQINAMLKSDKRSLPYTNEIVVRLGVEVDMNAMLDYEMAYRQIILELLVKNVYKIRFYVHVETYENPANPFSNCGIKYCFRYFIH